MNDPYGMVVERELRELAALHGVRDFVFRPLNRQRGAGAQREIGDFLLWIGDIAVVVSVKSRDPDVDLRQSPERRRSWFEKAIRKARDQIKGVVRALKNATPGELALESERGVQVPWDPTSINHYVGVVIVDARPPDEEYAPPVTLEPLTIVTMLADDWDFLHQVLPSTTSVARYILNRSLSIPGCPLGSESAILGMIVESENTGRELAVPDTGLPYDYFNQMVETHPDWFFGTDPDDRFALIVESMIEGLADPDPDFTVVDSPTTYLEIATFLDRIPLLHRVDLGKDVIKRCEQVGRRGSGYSAGRYGLHHGLLLVLADAAPRRDRANLLSSLTVARHSQALDAGAPEELVTVGVATEPIPTSQRSHDFVLIRGSIRSDPEFRADRDERFGVVDWEPLLNRWVGTARLDEGTSS